MTPEQLAEYLDFCRRALPDYTPEQRRQAAELVTWHLTSQSTPAKWLPDILHAHGLPLFGQAVGELLTHGEILPF